MVICIITVMASSIMSVLNMTFRFTDGLNPQVVMENNPQARHVPPIFLEPYCSTNTFFTGCNFFAVSPWPVPQVQWYSAVQTHPTNSRIWTFTTNRTANYLPGNFRSWTTCAFFQQSAKINLHSTPPSGQLVAVKSKCCGRTIPRSYSFKEVSSSHSSQCVLFNGPHHISQGSWSLREFDGQDSHVECLDSTQWWDNILSINCIYFLLFWCYCCSKSKIFMFGEDFSLPPLQTWWSPLLCFLSSGCENPRLWNSSRPPGTAQQPTPFTLLITLLITPYSHIFFAKPFPFSNFLIFLKTHSNTNKSSGEWTLVYLEILRLGT